MRMLNIVVPMAGAGSRFAQAGFSDPKPLITIHGVPMIRVVAENLRPTREHRFIFVAQRRHVDEYGLDELLPRWSAGAIVVPIEKLTDGAARTVLQVREIIDSADPLMIANSDQYVDANMDEYLNSEAAGSAGQIMTMTADDPKWSFVRLTEDGSVTEVVEKVVVSNQATVGIYNFSKGADFVWAADSMIRGGKMSNGEYYVAPVYNELIERGDLVTASSIGSVEDGMYGLGTPGDLAAFIDSPISSQAVMFAR
jgi:dTDP-glucose pyrophosphorylase